MSGYNSTPQYDDRSTPRYGGSTGARTPGARTPGQRTPGDRRDRRTPRGYGDATPLYDE